MNNFIGMFFRLWIIFCLVSTGVCAQQREATYRNPVIVGDFPDPTVIRVGNDYYAAGTTSDFAPNYPLYHSTDLVNWERIGAVFQETPAWIQGDCWAPELYYNNGTFYVYYTARKKSDHISCIGVATTKDIREGFTDHGPLIEWGKEAIDAFVFKDEDDRLYITWKAYGLEERPIEILAAELSADGLSMVGEHFTLTDPAKGWVGGGDEGQCIVKHKGYYYLFYSVGGCCDNRCDYRVHVARAESLKGDWEQYQQNPILQGGEQWKCSGHGTIVQTPDKRYFYLYHAYHTYDFEYVGRQGLLDELCWDKKTGWPYFKYGSMPTAQAPVPFAHTQQNRDLDIQDDFTTEKYTTYWQWDMNLGAPEVIRSDGLTLKNLQEGHCFWGISMRTGNFTMETEVMNREAGFRGLSIYGGPRDILAWGVAGTQVKLYCWEGGKRTELFSQEIGERGSVSLKVEALGGKLYRFLWSTDHTQWLTYPVERQLVEGTYLPQWGKGLRIGFLLEGRNTTGIFKYFNLWN